MDLTHDKDLMEQIRIALLKPQASRSYDDLLLLKSYISKTELITKDLAGIVSPRQMNDICRSLGMETYDSGQVVFHQGDVGDKVYIVLQGKCDVRVRYKIDLTQGQSEIREKYIVTYSSGQFFGERALQFDEPRSATVTALEYTHLVTIHKSIYMSVLNEAKKEISLNLKIDQFGTKEGVIKILSKVREKRSSQELGAVASFLYRRIPFFQKFTMQQLIELCRVAETVTIWGRSILFKQGQIGQAFYVILSGNVEVWVNDGNQQQQQSVPNAKKGHDLTEGLGGKVNQLVSGDVFGERALENESSLRMASIITGEDSTDLLVIAKEDYHNLVYVMMHEDSMHKLQLLRRTDLFNALDVVHLRALARFMEPKKFQINEEIATVGKRATEIVIIEKGECRVLTEITEGFEQHQYEEDRKAQQNHFLEESDGFQIQNVVLDGQSSVAISHHRIVPDTPPENTNKSFTTEYNHQLKRKNKKKHAEELKKVDILEISTKDLKKNTALTPLSKSMSNSKITNDDRSPGDNHVDEKQLSTSLEEKRLSQMRGKLTRFATLDLIPIGQRKKKLDLGRIAPDSVISPYVVLCESIVADIYHPETIVAASLVSAYVITKHDFFTHVPKDSKLAVIKLVRNYKAPVLNPLWENAPRVLDDNQWRMERAWEKFRSDFTTTSNKEVNILDSLKYVSKVHLSITSGNDQSKIKRSEGAETFQGGRVTIDWGLPPGVKAITMEAGAESGRKTPTVISSRPQSPSFIQNAQNGAEDNAMVKAKSVTDLIEASTVSNIIRKRLNQSHAQEAMLRATNNIGSLDPLANASAMKSKIAQATLDDGQGGTAINHSKLIEMPFVLIQIHREYSRAGPTNGAMQASRRMLKSYLRICGSFPSISKAKEMADKQLEHIFLTLYQSNVAQQEELLLNWNTFRGFESIPVNDSDHFLIYCRSSPMEYASIFPSKNILFSPFPAICRLVNQRYAVVVMNQIISDENPLLHGNNVSPKKKKQIIIGSKVKGSQKKEVMIGLIGGDGIGPEGDEEVFDVNHPTENQSDEEDNEDIGVSGKGASNKSKKTAPQARRMSMMGSSSNNVLVATSANTSSRQQQLKKVGNGTAPEIITNSSSPPPPTLDGGLATAVPQTESAVSLPEFIGTKKSSWPLYLQELSCLYESLIVSSTRLESLRYAIRRFGTMPSDVIAQASTNMTGNGDSLAATGCTDASNTTVHATPSAIHLKPMNDGTKGDRILRIIHHEQKKVCVLPLFKWILLNEETVDTLNFLYAFKESTIRKILLAEELDQTQEEAYDEDDLNLDDPQLLQLPGTSDNSDGSKRRFPGEYRDLLTEIEEKHLHPEMVKSFSEAGFIPNDPLQSINTKALDEGLNRSDITGTMKVSRSDGILFIDNNASRNKIEVIADQARALKILEKEIASKEMSKQIHALQNQFLDTHISYPILKTTGLSTPYSSSILSSPHRGTDEDANASIGGNRGRGQKDSVQLEMRLKALNKVVNETGRILSTHDQLCDLEHGTPTKKDAESQQNEHDRDGKKFKTLSTEGGNIKVPYVSPKATPHKKVVPKEERLRLTKDNKSGIMKERLHVIEALQKMQFVPSKSSTGGSSNISAQPTSTITAAEPASVSANAAVSALFGIGKNVNQGPTTQSTSAGRRLAESLRILSESLDSQLQQKLGTSGSQAMF